MTIPLEFTPEILKELNFQRYNHPSPLVQRRVETVWLKAHQLQYGQIAELAGVSENTMRDYLELYQTGGVEKLKELNFYHPVGELNQHVSSLETHFQNPPPASIKDKEAQQEIEEITGVRRSETQVAEFLKKKHWRCRKVGTLPAKADPDDCATLIKLQ